MRQEREENNEDEDEKGAMSTMAAGLIRFLFSILQMRQDCESLLAEAPVLARE